MTKTTAMKFNLLAIIVCLAMGAWCLVLAYVVRRNPGLIAFNVLNAGVCFTSAFINYKVRRRLY